MIADRIQQTAPGFDLLVLFQPELADDTRVAHAIQRASEAGATSFDDRQALSEHVAALDERALVITVICAGVPDAEHLAQQLLRIRNDQHIVLLAPAGDRRGLADRFRTLPIRARQLELIPQDTPDLIPRIAGVAHAAQARRQQREQIVRADQVIAGLQPHALDLTDEAIRRQLLEALPLGVIVAMADGSVVQANATAYRMLQLFADGSGASPPAHLSELIPQWDRRSADALPADEVITIHRLGRTQHLRLQTSVLAGQNTPPAMLITIEDVTAQQEARHILTATKAELESRVARDSQALTEITRERDFIKHFIASLTHDLRSPIAAAMLSSQLMMRQLQTSEGTAGTLLERVQRNLERLERMVEDLLDLIRHDMDSQLPIHPEPMRLDTLLRETLDDLAHLYGRRVAVQEPLPTIEGCWDHAGIRRIIENLGSNAIKYGDPNRPADAALEVGGRHVALHFRSHGPPIPLTAQKAIFEPFYRAENPSQQHIPGWGVGLAFVRVMTESHGGSVAMESSEAHGTIFSVRLPKIPLPD